MTVICIIVARSANGAIGLKGRIPWRIPSDMRFFKSVTTGHPVIMGWNTWASIGRPLPNRRNIVLTRTHASELPEGAEAASSLREALDRAGNEPKVFVMGGGSVYRKALPLADEAYITEIDQEFEGDAFFRLPDPEAWEREVLTEFSEGGCTGRFTLLRRKSRASLPECSLF